MSQTVRTKQSIRSHSKPRVSYYYHSQIAYFCYGASHPMQPYRMQLTQDLITSYGLYKKMYIYQPYRATINDMTKFHSEDYIDFLSCINPSDYRRFKKLKIKYGLRHPDCPIFEGMFEYCQLLTGGTINAALKLNKQKTDIAINWNGGLHHARKSKALGFCYVNDIVLGILELLKYHLRVLYVDIDVYHGNGVEEAFYTTDRVMTVSFHKFNEFPGTGDIDDIGAKQGKHYAINVPLDKGISDDNYETIFVPVMSRVMEIFQPTAIVLQCGADSLAGDPLGCFNLSLKGHGKCVEFIKSYKLPLLLLGGGGYKINNVSRCWAYETAIVLEHELPNDIPCNNSFEYFGPTYQLHYDVMVMQDKNSSKDLEKTKQKIFENLRMLPVAPSVQFQEIAKDNNNEMDSKMNSDDMTKVSDETNPDERLPQRDLDKSIQRENEYSDSENEGEGGRKDNVSFR